MNKQIELLKLLRERDGLELRQRVLEDKSDRTADESKEIETLDRQIIETREKVIAANEAATEEAEAAIVERSESTPENR